MFEARVQLQLPFFLFNMQGINKAKHAHLIDALLNFQQVTSQNNLNPDDVDQAKLYNVELKRRYRKYELLLQELASHIEAYEELSSAVRVQFLGRRLKELKKQTTTVQSRIANVIVMR